MLCEVQTMANREDVSIVQQLLYLSIYPKLVNHGVGLE